MFDWLASILAWAESLIDSIPNWLWIAGAVIVSGCVMLLARSVRRWIGGWFRNFFANTAYWGVIAGVVYGLYWLVREHMWQSVFTFTIDGNVEHFRTGHVPLLMLYSYLLYSIRVVPASLVASQRFLEMPFRHLNAGPAFVPRWICSMAFFDGTDQQTEHPAEPHRLFHQDSEQPIPDGMVPPLRITFDQGDNLDVNRDPLNRRITAVVSFTTVYAINQAHRFERTFGSAGLNGRQAIDEANRQLSDTGARFLTDLYSRQTLAYALGHKENATVELDRQIETVSTDWGVNMRRAEVKAFSLNHGLNRSIVAVPTAVNDAEAERAKAAGDRDALAARAEGERQQRRLRGLGDGEAVQAYTDQTGITPHESQDAEIARRFADAGNVVIMGGSQGGLMQQLMGTMVGSDAVRSRRNRRRRQAGGAQHPQQRPQQPPQQPPTQQTP